jgi:hypothetical protein
MRSFALLAGSKVELEINGSLGRPNPTDVISKNRDAPAVSLLAQTLEDLLSAIRVGVQQPRDARLEGIKDTAARHRTARLEMRTCRRSSGGDAKPGRFAPPSDAGAHGSRGSYRTSRNRSPGGPRLAADRADRRGGENVLAQT